MLAKQHSSVTALQSCCTLCNIRPSDNMPCSLSTFLLQNSQFWLAQCQADNSLLEGCARATGQRLLHELWPLEDPQSASPQASHLCTLPGCGLAYFTQPWLFSSKTVCQMPLPKIAFCMLSRNIAYTSTVTFCSCCRLLMPLSGWQKEPFRHACTLKAVTHASKSLLWIPPLL